MLKIGDCNLHLWNSDRNREHVLNCSAYPLLGMAAPRQNGMASAKTASMPQAPERHPAFREIVFGRGKIARHPHQEWRPEGITRPGRSQPEIRRRRLPKPPRASTSSMSRCDGCASGAGGGLQDTLADDSEWGTEACLDNFHFATRVGADHRRAQPTRTRNYPTVFRLQYG